MLDAVRQSCYVRLPAFSATILAFNAFSAENMNSFDSLDLSTHVIALALVALGIVHLCSQHQILSHARRSNIEALSLVANVLLHSEPSTGRARLFLREAFGLFKRACSAASDPDLHGLKTTIGPTLFCAEELESTLSLMSFSVAALKRKCSELFTGGPDQFLYELPSTWEDVDRIHALAQKLFRTVCTSSSEGAEDETGGDQVLVIKLDVKLLHLTYTIHARLEALREQLRWTSHAMLLDDLLQTSSKRVRKCLKLTSYAPFYSRSKKKTT
ncbi:hypothetical protein RQP46_005714 [Phenoliferia psychrophenolica]